MTFQDDQIVELVFLSDGTGSSTDTYLPARQVESNIVANDFLPSLQVEELYVRVCLLPHFRYNEKHRIKSLCDSMVNVSCDLIFPEMSHVVFHAFCPPPF